MIPTTKLLAGGAVLVAVASTPVFAAGGKYCLNPASGGSGCGFTSLEQCQETMRGRNGWCSEQVDFDAWAASHGQSSSGGTPENAYAYYPPGGRIAGRRMMPADKQQQDAHKKDTPTKGVGAE